MAVFCWNQYQLEYEEWGSGNQCYFFFHGFGRNTGDAQVFLPLLQPHHRLVSVHLFFHGKSSLPHNQLVTDPPTQDSWKTLFKAFLSHLGVTQFHLIGYSMGGRIAMVTALQFPDDVLSMLLMAPDGLKINRVYQFASGTTLGRKMYRSIIENPRKLFRLAAMLNQAGVLNDKLHRFVHVHLDTVEKRQLVHDAWLAHRYLFPDLDQLARWMDEQKRPVYFLFGEYDSIIRVRLGVRFSKKVKRPADQWLYTVPLGHRLLETKTVELVKEKKLSFH